MVKDVLLLQKAAAGFALAFFFLCYSGSFRRTSSLTFLVSYCMKILNYYVWERAKCMLLSLDAAESRADSLLHPPGKDVPPFMKWML